jgi:hypothetical protein
MSFYRFGHWRVAWKVLNLISLEELSDSLNLCGLGSEEGSEQILFGEVWKG